MDIFVPFASREYFVMLIMLAFSRGADFLSTRIATPRLVLEGNPIVKWLGWRWSVVVNILLVLGLALCPISAIVVGTASTLVAARNFQSAWYMRSMGEDAYRRWYLQRLIETPLGLYLFCLAGNTFLTAGIGVAVILCSADWNSPGTAIGLGIIAYAAAVLLYTLLALWRNRHWRE